MGMFNEGLQHFGAGRVAPQESRFYSKKAAVQQQQQEEYVYPYNNTEYRRLMLPIHKSRMGNIEFRNFSSSRILIIEEDGILLCTPAEIGCAKAMELDRYGDIVVAFVEDKAIAARTQADYIVVVGQTHSTINVDEGGIDIKVQDALDNAFPNA